MPDYRSAPSSHRVSARYCRRNTEEYGIPQNTVSLSVRHPSEYGYPHVVYLLEPVQHLNAHAQLCGAGYDVAAEPVKGDTVAWVTVDPEGERGTVVITRNLEYYLQ